ncbi:MAG: hypothetical protein F6K42_07505 [Leptolyngbya sp. SIO1D8]|nr:hypothetical protein [Leptolyngbya sp. SIO1D8]
MSSEVTCAFCGTHDPKTQSFFSGRPRARQQAKATPFACASCVTRASQAAILLQPATTCTFCGRQTALVLYADEITMCADCVSFCADLVSTNTSGDGSVIP